MASASSEPTTEDHLRISQDLLTLASWLVTERPDDTFAIGWGVTHVYYAVVHALSACVLARHGVRVPSHQDRQRWFDEFPELRKAEKWDYRLLKKASEESRYQGQGYTRAQYDVHRATAERLTKHWSAMALRPR